MLPFFPLGIRIRYQFIDTPAVYHKSSICFALGVSRRGSTLGTSRRVRLHLNRSLVEQIGQWLPRITRAMGRCGTRTNLQVYEPSYSRLYQSGAVQNQQAYPLPMRVYRTVGELTMNHSNLRLGGRRRGLRWRKAKCKPGAVSRFTLHLNAAPIILDQLLHVG